MVSIFGRRPHVDFIVLVLLLLSPLHRSYGQSQNEVFEPLKGPVLQKFDTAFDRLEHRPFGIFRDDSQRPAFQYIEEEFLELSIPGRKEKVGFLVLPYNVSGYGSFNGWWLKLGGADWNRYKNGELILRLRRLDPQTDTFRRSVRLEQEDTQCTTEFKIELKTIGSDERIRVVGLGQRLMDEHLTQQKRSGYFDLRIPLVDFGLDLTRCYELTLVFENTRIRTLQRGALGIRAILLTSEREQSVDQVLRSGAR